MKTEKEIRERIEKLGTEISKGENLDPILSGHSALRVGVAIEARDTLEWVLKPSKEVENEN